jgi:hypothetical protein
MLISRWLRFGIDSYRMNEWISWEVIVCEKEAGYDKVVKGSKAEEKARRRTDVMHGGWSGAVVCGVVEVGPGRTLFRAVILVGKLCGICRLCRHVGGCWRSTVSIMTSYDVICVILLSNYVV